MRFSIHFLDEFPEFFSILLAKLGSLGSNFYFILIFFPFANGLVFFLGNQHTIQLFRSGIMSPIIHGHGIWNMEFGMVAFGFRTMAGRG